MVGIVGETTQISNLKKNILTCRHVTCRHVMRDVTPKNHQWAPSHTSLEQIHSIMSFFGLTALGPKNSFQASRLGQPTLHLFDEDDLKNAFMSIVADAGNDANGTSVSLENVPKLLDKMYESRTPDNDVQLLVSELENCGCEDDVSWDNLRFSFNRTIKNIESKLDNVMKETDSCYFGSHSNYRDAMRRHKRAVDDPDKLFSKPLTASQEYGWFGCNSDGDRSNPQKIMGKKSCAETIYQSELIKSGVLL